MDNGSREKGRMILYAVAGVYLLYLAYQIFQGRAEMSGNMIAVMWIVMAAFALFGAGILVFACRRLYRLSQDGDEPESDLEEDDPE